MKPLLNSQERMTYRNLQILFWSSCFGVLCPIVIPLIHLTCFKNLWGEFPVNRTVCTNSCWDTVFKGPYESGVANYKHVYFNSTTETLKMWTITVFMVISFYETFKRIIILWSKSRLRLLMFLILCTSIPSHYYSWWGYWNYYNDEFFTQWYHQMFFTLTELICSIIVIYYLDSWIPTTTIPLVVICTISFFHILISSSDQFVYTVIHGQGKLHQILRDLFLMTTDILNVSVSLYELKKNPRDKKSPIYDGLTQRNSLIVIFILLVIMFTYILVFPS